MGLRVSTGGGRASPLPAIRPAVGNEGPPRGEGLLPRLLGLESAAQDLARTLTLGDLARYRGEVEGFLRELLSGSVGILAEGGFSGGRGRIFRTVILVNEHLWHLGAEVLKGEAGRLAVLRRIDAIRGLLLDLYR